MTTPAEHLAIDGIDVIVEGTAGRPTVLMLHGWPDTAALWEPTARALAGDYRTVRFTLPGYDITRPRRPTRLEDSTALIARIADAVSPDEPVIMLQHDWGCVVGWEFAMRHPERVSKIVAVDVGDANSPDFVRSLSVKEGALIFAYQSFLTLAWRIGRPAGDRMTRWMARTLQAPSPQESIGSSMNYHYDMVWTRSYGSLAKALPVKPTCPTLYFWGARKPAQFQSAKWLAWLAAQPGSKVAEMPTGHWVMVDAEQEFLSITRDWLLAQG